MKKLTENFTVFMYQYMNTKTLLGMVIFIALFLRMYQLGTIPPHLTQDEAALGYNAYSILKTGRDEYGELLPIIFKSFGDYKPGLYVYLTIPSVVVFGLTEFAVRLPSALAGVTAVFLIYLVTNEILRTRRTRPQNDGGGEMENGKWKTGLIASFLLAINPWHIHFSRGAWEANVSLTLTLASIYLFLKTITIVRDRHGYPLRRYLILSSIFFALTFNTYQGAKLSTVIVLIVLTVVYWQECKKLIKKNFSTVVQSTVLGLIIISPIILSLFQGKTGRLEVYSVFSHTRAEDYLQTFLDHGNEKTESLTYYLYHSESLNFFRGVMGRWFNHYSGKFLFFDGDWQNPRHSAPYQGMFLIVEFVPLILGGIYLVRRADKLSLLVLSWLILSPLPAVLTKDQVQAVRALNMVIPMVIVLSFGIYALMEIANNFDKLLIKRTFLGSFVILYIASFLYFIDAYFIHIPAHNAKFWNYGYKQTINELSQLTSSEDDILFQQSYAQPYIYFLFYEKYDPAEYQEKANLIDTGVDVGLVGELDNKTFRFFSWPVNQDEFDYIVGDGVVVSEDVGEGFKVIKEIKYPDGKQTAVKVVKDI